MKKRTIIALVLLSLLSTISFQYKIPLEKFHLKEINIENNNLVEEKELKKSLAPIYNKNLFFLKRKQIEKLLVQNSFIESFEVKKKYPNILKIKIFEKRPIAVLLNKKNKYYLSEKIDLIQFKNLKNYENLPYIYETKKDFKILYNNLIEINFPFDEIKKYKFYETNRWDLQLRDDKIIKLPSKNYIKNLENYLNLKNKNNFKKYKVFDYRIKNQLILK